MTNDKQKGHEMTLFKQIIIWTTDGDGAHHENGGFAISDDGKQLIIIISDTLEFVYPLNNVVCYRVEYK